MKMKIIVTLLIVSLLGGTTLQLHAQEGFSYYHEIDEEKWITSGNYQYGIINEQEKSAVLYRINSTEEVIVVPEAIDGYTIKYIGNSSELNEEEPLSEELCVMKNNKDTLRCLEIPQTVTHIGVGAFANCSNLEEVKFPKTDYLQIEEVAFFGCNKIKNVTLRSVHYEGGIFTTQFERLELNNTNIYEPDVRYPDWNAKKVVINGKSNCILRVFSREIEEVYLNDNSTLRLSEKNAIKLYVNGKKAKVTVEGISTRTSLYTIPAQKNAISVYKEYCLPYHIKSTGSMKKVTRKKSGKKYRYTWEKVKTTIKTHKYNWDKGKWKKTKKNIATQYQIYGKAKKSDTYQLMKTTKKRKFTTKYKYVKVKPVKIWLE